MEPTPPVLAKKLWSIVRIMILLMKKGISKRKFMMDLHVMMKRGKIASKAIGNLMFHHHSTFSCRSQDPHLSFITPREYEFSCSNSPAFPFHITNKRKHSHHHHHHHHYNNSTRHHHKNHHDQYLDEDITTVSAVKKVLEMLNNEVTVETTVGASSPSPVIPGFGFGRSPFVRQLRITDSPFPLRNPDEDSSHVDREAEEFISRFYEQLRLQNS